MYMHVHVHTHSPTAAVDSVQGDMLAEPCFERVDYSLNTFAMPDQSRLRLLVKDLPKLLSCMWTIVA